MPECQNCGEPVSKRYVQVVTPRGLEEPRACPRCPDLTRDVHGRIREKRA